MKQLLAAALTGALFGAGGGYLTASTIGLHGPVGPPGAPGPATNARTCQAWSTVNEVGGQQFTSCDRWTTPTP